MNTYRPVSLAGLQLPAQRFFMTVEYDTNDADEWVIHYRNLYSRPTTHNDMKDILETWERDTIFNELDNLIKGEEILGAVKELKNNKAAGLDKIKNEMIKCSITSMKTLLQKLFNKVLSTGCYPNSWSQGYIVSLFKSGCKSDLNNYRGITISSCLGKVFSAILNKRLVNFLASRNIMHDTQIGSCKGSRTSDHIYVLKSLIDKYTKDKGRKNRKLYAAFVDFRKALDLVWREALYLKLLQVGVGSNSIK